MDTMEVLLMLCLGVGLSAACGFRIFVPLLVMSIAANAGQGYLQLGSGFEWIATPQAMLIFAVATALEIGGYYIPWLDNLLDTIATPASIVAGTIVTAASVKGMGPEMTWALGLIAGGGAALAVQTSTVVVRAASSVTTGGIGNSVVSTAETVFSTLLAILAIVVPILAVLLLLTVAYFVWRRFFKGRYTAAAPA